MSDESFATKAEVKAVEIRIPLIPGCNEIVVTNNNAAPVNVKVIWGIDG